MFRSLYHWLCSPVPAPSIGAGHPVYSRARSPHWSTIRAAFLRKFPTCAACGTAEFLTVHHKKPYHLFPDLELIESNLITLCESPAHNDHFIFGHLLSWTSWNERVVTDAEAFLERVRHRPGAEKREG